MEPIHHANQSGGMQVKRRVRERTLMLCQKPGGVGGKAGAVWNTYRKDVHFYYVQAPKPGEV